MQPDDLWAGELSSYPTGIPFAFWITRHILCAGFECLAYVPVAIDNLMVDG